MMLKIRIMAQERYFRSLRESVGLMRQRRQSMAYDKAAIEIQRLCGEIESALDKCRQHIQ